MNLRLFRAFQDKNGALKQASFLFLVLLFYSETALAEKNFCEVRKSFSREILKHKNDPNLAFSSLQNRKLVLVGESHLEGDRANHFYLRLLRNQFSEGEKSCFFIELDEKTQQATLDQCFGEKASLTHPACEDLAFTIRPIFNSLYKAMQENRLAKVYAVDEQEGWPGESEYRFDRGREKYMAKRIQQHMASGICHKGIWMGGVSHLTGTYSSIPKRLKGKLKDNSAVVQIVFTGPGRWSDSEAKRYDPRWHPYQDSLYCSSPIPQFKESFMVRGKDIPSFAIMPEGLEDQVKEPFGNWKDFEYSFFIDFFEGSPR